MSRILLGGPLYSYTSRTTPQATSLLQPLKLTLALQRVELIEERRNVDNDTGADERRALGVDETCVSVWF